MHFRFLPILILFLYGSVSFSQVKLSDQSKVSIVIEGPYQKEVYSAFGHIGFRIQDKERKLDKFFNYGVYDFDQENFFLNFAQGLLKYKVVAYDFKYLERGAKRENRYLKEQVLNLTLEERQAFFSFLTRNIRPENAEYLYDYVYDNCATRIRDVTNELFPGQITYDLSYKQDGKTIRDLMDDYLQYQAWGDFGIDLGLGMQIDREATAEVYMFLPEYVMKAFENATIRRDGVEFPLVDKTEDLFVPEAEEFGNGRFTPFNVFLILFFVVGLITNRNYKSGKRTKWIDTLLFSVVGFGGLWVVYLWFGTEHLSKWNLNILWAIPLHLPMVILLAFDRFKKAARAYFKLIAIWYCLLFLVWAILPQPLGMPLVPLVLAMTLRAFYINYDLRKAI